MLFGSDQRNLRLGRSCLPPISSGVTLADLWYSSTARSVLRPARHRLESTCGGVPESVALLQADIADLPFKNATFATVSYPAGLHEFDNPVVPVTELRRVLAGDGTLYITSLVSSPGRRFANAYLRQMHRGGQIAAPRSADEVAHQLQSIEQLSNLRHRLRGSMAFSRTMPGHDEAVDS